jgi:hypothetical protein
MNRLVLAVVLLASTLALAGDLDPKKAAEIRRDREKAMADIDKKYGNKKLSKAEMNAKAAEQNAAEAKVLDKHGVSAKDYGRYEAKSSKGDRAAADKEAESPKQKDEAAAKAAANKKDGPKEIQVQKGFSDENPTVMEEKDGAPPVVEKGLPKDGK